MMSSEALARTSGSLLSGCIIGAAFSAGLGAYKYISLCAYFGVFSFMVYMAARDELKEQREQHK